MRSQKALASIELSLDSPSWSASRSAGILNYSRNNSIIRDPKFQLIYSFAVIIYTYSSYHFGRLFREGCQTQDSPRSPVAAACWMGGCHLARGREPGDRTSLFLPSRTVPDERDDFIRKPPVRRADVITDRVMIVPDGNRAARDAAAALQPGLQQAQALCLESRQIEFGKRHEQRNGRSGH